MRPHTMLSAILTLALSVACSNDLLTGVVAPTDAGPTAAAPAGGVHVPIAVQRFDGGNGNVLVSNAIPLTPGLLRANELGKVRLYVDGRERSIYVESLEGRHPDGSLRSVLVQFNATLGPTDVLPGEFIVEQARGTADLPKPKVGRSQPAAVALPTDPNYLIGTNIVGPTMTAVASQAQGAPYSKYEQDFGTFADQHWATEGESGCYDYYDRALTYYAFWARTGKAEYWRRGTRCAAMYRTGYLEPNNYGSSPHWSQMEGLDAHYTLTGDDSSRYAIGQVAHVLGFWYPLLDSIPQTRYMEDRIRARTLISILMSWRVNAGGNAAMYQAQLDTAITRITHSQSADGSYRFPSTCGESENYMTGQLNDALIKTYMYYKADPRIVQAVQHSADFLWNTQWVPAKQVFQYMSGVCPAEGNTNPALDLNNLIINTFAFTYARSQDATYRDRADQVFAGAVANTSLDGTKQFNQQYYSSYLYLKFRQ
jgi:hypothetical protein